VGTKVFVWGGYDTTGQTLPNDGALYDPEHDSWEPLTMDEAPVGRLWPVAVWTGEKVILWGGQLLDAHQTKTGAIYDPTSGTWVAMQPGGAPPRNKGLTAAWTTGTMLVFGGRDDGGGNVEQTLYSYALTPNLWTAEANPLPPLARSNAFGAWTGTKFLVFGGLNATKWALGDGGLYNPAAKTWTYLVGTTASAARASLPNESGWGAWTGSTMILMGGGDGTGTYYSDGLVLDPEAAVGSQWNDIPEWSPAGPHLYGVGVWTGEEFIVWGGTDGSTPMVDGSRWMP